MCGNAKPTDAIRTREPEPDVRVLALPTGLLLLLLVLSLSVKAQASTTPDSIEVTADFDTQLPLEQARQFASPAAPSRLEGSVKSDCCPDTNGLTTGGK